jgi:hypothetical protein
LTFTWLFPYIARARKGKVSVKQCGNLREHDYIHSDLDRFNDIYRQRVQKGDRQPVWTAIALTYYRLIIFVLVIEVIMGAQSLV